MIPIYICEDSKEELDILKRLIENIIDETGLTNRVYLACSTPDPNEILTYTEKKMQSGIYFLDIDLGPDVINGIQLGTKIRVLDPAAFIVMITAHGEAAPLTFKYKIGAKDYIIKSHVQEVKIRIRECIIQAHLDLSNNKNKEYKILSFKKDYTSFSMFQNQIYYFEVIAKKQRKVRIYELYSSREVSGTMQEIKKQLDENFFQCHKSYIVNMEHLVNINHKLRLAILDNGNKVPISFRKSKKMELYFMEFYSNKSLPPK